MFVLRSIINHELYTDNVNVDGQVMHGVAGWSRQEDAQEYLNAKIREKFGKYHVEDWIIINLEDNKYYTINSHLKNDSDFKAFYYSSGVYEVLNTITGRLTRYEKDEK